MVVIHTIQDGPEIAVVHVYLQCDDTQDLHNQTIVDPSTLSGYVQNMRLSVQEIMYDFAGFDAQLVFDSGVVQQQSIWVLPEGSGSGIRDFRSWGNFRDYSSSLDGTGKLQMNTNGFTTVTDQGTMLLRIRKNVYPVVPA